MRRSFALRWPWLLLALTMCTLFSIRSDYRVRDLATVQLDRLTQRLAFQAGAGSLDWLAVNPEVASATILDLSNRVLAKYQNSAHSSTSPDYVRSHESNGVKVEVTARLPGWTSTQTELPLVALAVVLLFLAAPVSSQEQQKDQTASPGLEFPLSSTSGSLVLELGSDMRITKVSRGIERFGYKPAELLGTPVGDFVERFHPLHQQSVLGVARAGGGRMDSVVSSSSIEDSTGSIEKIVVTLASASSGSEGTELRERYARLESLCQSICDNARDGVVVLDSDATMVYANASFRGFLATRCNQEPGLLTQLCPRFRLAFIDALHAALEGGAAGLLEIEIDASGGTVLEGALHGLWSPGQSSRLAVGIFRDVTEARRLEAEVERARERAGHSQKIEALGRMAGGVAHDFNNLLASIIFNLEAAQASLEAESAAKPYLDEVRLAASKAGSVTQQLLLYSRKKPAIPRLLSCHTVVQDAARLTHGMRANVPVELDLEAVRDSVVFDDGQLDQVLVNLIVNAKDAVGSDGRVVVSTQNRYAAEDRLPSLSTSCEYIVIGVRDNGSGIPLEIQSKIFEPYFTTKEVGKGTGLGLSTAVAIVEKAGGQLTLRSRPGETVFEIWIPVAQRKATVNEDEPTGGLGLHSAQTTSERSQSGQTCSERGDGAAILLVEDERSIRTLLHRLLTQQGYQVTSAATGSDAAEMLGGSTKFDILVTDLVLPGLTGPELAKRFQDAHPGRPVLFMSGFPGDTLEEAEVATYAGFLAKPFSPQQLLGSLRQILEEPAR